MRIIRQLTSRATRLMFLLLSALALGVTASPSETHAWSGRDNGYIDATDLPREAQKTLRLIEAGGPFRYSQDGVVFNNFEKRLPTRKRGYYHEYTVPTPGARNRGARRIITGREGEQFYTDDHYETFKRIRPFH